MKRRLVLTSIISIILIVVLMIGSTYSIFVTSNIDDNLNVYKTGNLDVTYTLSDDNIVYSSNLPVSDDAAVRVKPYRITVNNIGNVPYKFNVILNNETATDSIAPKYMVTKVGKLEPKTLDNCTNGIIKEGVIVPANDSAIIDIRVYLSENVQNSEIGKSFYANLSIDGLAIYNENDEIDNSILMLPKNTLVTFDANGGVLDDFGSKELESSSLYGEMPKDPVRTGYTFDGWYTEKTGGVEVTENINLVTEDDHTLYARWVANTYTVTFDANGGTTPSIASKTVTYDEQYGDLATTNRDGYIFIGWYTASDGGSLVTSDNKVLITENQTLYARWSDSSAPIATINTTSTLKSTTQTATLICSSNNEIVSYYWGTSSNPSDSDYVSGNPTQKKIKNVGTYYLFCKDTNGNVNTTGTDFATGKAVYYSYNVNNMLDTITGTQGTYTTANYEQKSTNTYIAPSGTNLTLESIYTAPGTVGTQVTFIGVSTGVASTTAATVSKTVPTLNDNTTYSMWFNRISYTLTLSKGTGISSVSGAGSKKWGASVTIDATVSTGYTWVNWTGYSTTTTKNYTFTMPGQAVTYTANATDQTAPSAPTITRSDYNTFTYSSTDDVGVTGYYVSKSSTEPTVSTPQSTFALDTWTTVTSTGNLTLSSGTYYVWARDAAGNVSTSSSIGAYTVSITVGSGSSLTTRYDSTSSTTGTSFTSTSLVVLEGTNIWSQATANTGYNTPVLKRGGSTVTNPSYEPITGTEKILSEATANTYTVKFYANKFYLKGGSGVVAAVINGRLFYKPYTSASLVGMYYDGTYTGPLLVGTTANSVAYSESYSGNVHTSTNTFTYNGTTYYYSAWGNVMEGEFTDSSGLSHRMRYTSATREAAARALISDNDSTSSSKTQSFTYGSSQALTSNTFTKTGYTFKGWATSPTGAVVYNDAASVSNLTTTNGATVNLYAVWEPVTNTVTFSANSCPNGTVSTSSKTVAYGSIYSTMPTLTCSGYTLNGWYTNSASDRGTKITNISIAKITAAQTLYARWKGQITLNYQDNVLEDISNWIPENSSTYINILEGDNLQPAMRTSSVGKRDGFIVNIDTDKLANTNNRNMEFNYAILQKGTLAIGNEFEVDFSTSSGYPFYYVGVGYSVNLPEGVLTRQEFNDVDITDAAYIHFYFHDSGDGPIWVSDVQLNSWEYGETINGKSSLPTPTRTGYTFDGWYDVKDTPTVVMQDITGNNSNVERRTLISGLDYNTTYTISMDSAVRNSGSGTQFMVRVENAWDSSTSYSSVSTNYGSNISFDITTPTASDASNNPISLVFYAGLRGSTSGNKVTFTNVWVRPKGTTRTQYTSSTNIPANKYLYAHWTPTS